MQHNLHTKGPLRRVLEVSRSGLWSTQLWFYMLPLGGRDVWDRWPFWLGALYVTFPLAFLLYGWNDLFDYLTDLENPRKGNLLFGARLSRDELAALPFKMAIVQAPFWCIFLWLIGPAFLAWAVGVLAVNAAYNGPRRALKGVPILDLLAQAGYLLVFVLSSWLNDAPQLGWPAYLFGALFAMHSHLLNEIADAAPDRKAGRNTTAVAIGVARSKLLIAALLWVEAGLSHVYFKSPLVTAFLVFAALLFVIDYRLRGNAAATQQQLRWVLLAWNGVTIASLYWVWKTALFTMD